MTSEKPETIRNWYDRTTRKTRKVIVWASVFAAISAVFFYFTVPPAYTLRLQVFNGAWVIPIAALIWIVAFVWIFLIPSREVGFRSQESLERTMEMVSRAVDESIKPALKVWQQLGERLEAELDGGMITEFQDAIRALKETAERVQASTASSTGDLRTTSIEIKKFSEDIRPAIAALKRIEGHLEGEIKDGFFDQARMAMESIRHLGGGPAPSRKAQVPAAASKAPDLDFALKLVSKKSSAPAVPSTQGSSPVTVQIPATEFQVPTAVYPQGPLPVPAAQTPISVYPQGPLPIGPVPVAKSPARIDKIQV
jgi:hypothetical protein